MDEAIGNPEDNLTTMEIDQEPIVPEPQQQQNENSSSSSNEGTCLPFLVTHWLANSNHLLPAQGAATEREREAINRIRRAAVDLSAAFHDLGSFGTTTRVSTFPFANAGCGFFDRLYHCLYIVAFKASFSQ